MPNYELPRRQTETTSTHLKTKFLLSLFVIAGILAITNIVVSARLSNVGLNIARIQDQSLIVNNQIQKLQQQVNTQSSLLSLKAKANNFGFVTEYQAIALPKSLPVAFNSSQ